MKEVKPLYVITSLGRGIVRTVDYQFYEGGYLLYRQGRFSSMAPKTAYFEDEDGAQARARWLRVRRVASLKRQLAAAKAALGTPALVSDAQAAP
jgi:hypothetical protein